MRRAANSSGIDLRVSWPEASYCAVDVEITGLDLRRDSIVSIGSAGIRDGRIISTDSCYSLIWPACPVPAASMHIHCLRPADLENAPATRDVGQEIACRLVGRIVVAHAAWIERAFLRRLLRQARLRFATPMIDAAALAPGPGLRAGPGPPCYCPPSIWLRCRYTHNQIALIDAAEDTRPGKPRRSGARFRFGRRRRPRGSAAGSPREPRSHPVAAARPTEVAGRTRAGWRVRR